jgi:hypothetical protein
MKGIGRFWFKRVRVFLASAIERWRESLGALPALRGIKGRPRDRGRERVCVPPVHLALNLEAATIEGSGGTKRALTSSNKSGGNRTFPSIGAGGHEFPLTLNLETAAAEAWET